MKRTLLLLLFGYALFGQIEPYVYLSKKAQVLKGVHKEVYNYKYTILSIKEGDTLRFTIKTSMINGAKDTIIRKFTFNNPDDKTCDFEQTIFPCDSCSNQYIQRILEDKVYKWKKISENKYLSRPFWHIEMTLSYNSYKFCNEVTFKYSNLDKAEYKKLYNQPLR
jgi:hypothetical protein